MNTPISLTKHRLLFLMLFFCIPFNSVYSDNTDKILEYYFSGNFNSLYPEIKQYLTNANNKEEEAKRLIYVLNMCETHWTLKCSEYVTKLTTLTLELKDSHNAEILKYYNMFYIARLTNYHTRYNEKLKPFIERGDLNLIPGKLGYVKGINSHFIQMHYYLIDNNYKEARNSAFRALSSIASLKNPSPFILAKLLRKSISALLITGEPILAYSMYKKNADFIGKHLFMVKPEFLAWRKVESDLLLQLGDLDGSLKAENQVLEIFNTFKMDNKEGDFYIQNTYSNLGAICLLKNDKDCISLVINNHPYLKWEKMKEVNIDALKQDWRYLIAIILKGLSQSINNNKISKDIIDTVNQWQGRSYNELEKKRIDSYREYLLSQVKGSPDAKKHALNSAIIVLDMHRAKNRIDPYGFRVKNSVEELILLNAIKVIKNDPLLIKKYMLQIMELLKKSTKDIEARDIKLLANAENANQKRAIHSVIRLVNKRNNNFISDINNLVTKVKNNKEQVSEEYIPDKLNAYYIIENDILRLQKSVKISYKKVPQNIDSSYLQNHLNKNDAFITAIPIKNTIYSLCITKNDVYVGESQFKPNMAKLHLKLLNLALQRQDPPNAINDNQFPIQSSKYLYLKLITPIAECIKRKKQIIWLPFNEIDGIPISTFVSPDDKLQKNLRDVSWLFKDFSISYSTNSHGYISSLILSLDTNKQGAFLGIGDPVLKKSNFYGNSRGKVKIPNANNITNSILEFNELPETSLEINSSLLLYAGKSKALLRRSASEEKFRDEFTNEYEILSFATHGILPEEIKHVNDSSLILTPIDGNDSFNDGLLRSTEISDLNISANIIQLSACNTAKRSISKSKEYLDGLSVAFSKSGAPNVLGSLWYVDSISTQKIMELFNKNYKHGYELGEALRLAKLDFINNSDVMYSNPRFWAPFILQGSPHSRSKQLDKSSSIAYTKEYYKSGGEILKSFETKTDYYFYGFHDLQKNGRYKSYLKKINKQLNVEKWVFSDKEFIINDVQVNNSKLILLGYKTEGLKSIPYLIELSNGVKSFEKRLCSKCSINNVGVKVVGDQIHIIYFIEGRAVGKKKVPIYLEHLLLNPDYSKKSVNKFFLGEVSSIYSFKSSNIEINNENLIFSISERYFPLPLRSQVIDKYGFVFTCYDHHKSSIYEINLNNNSKNIMTTISGYVSKIQVIKGKVYLLGKKRDSCKSPTKIFLSSIKNNEIYYNFFDESFFDASSSSFLIYKENIFIVGYESRIFGFTKKSSIDFLTNFTETLNSQKNMMYEGFIIKLDPSGRLIQKNYFPAGNSVVFSTAIINKNNIKVGGSLGYHVATYDIPVF